MSISISRMSRIAGAATLLAVMGCDSTAQEQPVNLESTEARLSYGIGLRMGQRMAADGMAIDVNAYAAGLADAIEGAEARLTEEEINTDIEKYAGTRQAEVEADWDKQVVSNYKQAKQKKYKRQSRDCNTLWLQQVRAIAPYWQILSKSITKVA